MDLRIAEYSGLDAANPLDVVATATGTGCEQQQRLCYHHQRQRSVGRCEPRPDADRWRRHRLYAAAINQSRQRHSRRSRRDCRWQLFRHGHRAPGRILDHAARRPARLFHWRRRYHPAECARHLTATAASSSQINLRWGAATDNVGVTGYLIERCSRAGCSNFAQIATVDQHDLQQHRSDCLDLLQLSGTSNRRRQ